MKLASSCAVLCVWAGAMSIASHAAEAPKTAPAAVVAAAPAGIVVYDQPNFKGQTLTLDKATPDLTSYKFNDRIASLVINGGNDWVLCENRNYGGRCIRVTVKADDLGLLQLGGRVSSLYPTPAQPAAPATPAP